MRLYEMISIEEALGRILEFARVLDSEEIDTSGAHGRVLAEDALAPQDMPPFPSTSVDGYAVVSSDTLPARRVLAEITAGRPVDVRVEAGTAVRIMTGAPLPSGADAVVMVEDTRPDGDLVYILKPPAGPGANVMPVGLDLKKGQLVLSKGTVIGPPEIGLLCTIGKTRVQVYRQPVVGMLSTGDELVEPWETPAHGKIRDSNRYSLLAAIKEAGAFPVSLGIAPDDEEELRQKVMEGLERIDVLITSGGVSMGTRDLIKPLLEEIGSIHFGRISFKPGKPLTFATIDEKLFFGLPGFPVSSLVSFEVFVRPALLKMQGHPDVMRPKVDVILEEAVKPSRDRTEYQRARIAWRDGRLVARTTGLQVSSRLLSMVGANGLIIIPPGEEPIPAGREVKALLVGPLAGP